MIDEWKPEPLVTPLSEEEKLRAENIPVSITYIYRIHKVSAADAAHSMSDSQDLMHGQ